MKTTFTRTMFESACAFIRYTFHYSSMPGNIGIAESTKRAARALICLLWCVKESSSYMLSQDDFEKLVGSDFAEGLD